MECAFVVLGHKLLPDGSPSHFLASRVQFACEQFSQRKHVSNIIVMTGGRVQDSAIQSEAECMKRLAEKHGVPPENVVLEDQARTTYENAINARLLLQPLQPKSVFIITSAYHMRRARLIFERLFQQSFPHVEYLSVPDDFETPEERTSIEDVERWLMGQVEQHLSCYRN